MLRTERIKAFYFKPVFSTVNPSGFTAIVEEGGSSELSEHADKVLSILVTLQLVLL